MHIKITPGHGDAVPGGYSGSLFAGHEGRYVGSIDYQTVTGKPGLKVALLEVLPAYQGRGIGSGLLMAAMRESPGPVDPGWMTDQGYLTWQTRGRAISQHYKPPAWTPDLPEFDAADVRPEREIPEPEFEVEI
jgi:GNAT superfamily N-acetyltransferase